MFRWTILVLLVSGVSLVGCGESGDGDGDYDDGCGCWDEDDEGCGDEDESATASSKSKVYSPDQGSATIKGTVKFEGKPPRRRRIDVGSEQYCTDSHKDSPIFSETAIVSPAGELKNVFVSVKSGLKGWKFNTPGEAAVLDQTGCTYVPHVLGMQKGQVIRIVNNDPIMHNVHAYHLKTRKDLFNFGQSKKGQSESRTLQRTGMVQVKCDVHGWMGSYIGVVNHPFFSISDDAGAFRLADLPAGTYVVEAWHEKFGSHTQTVTVADGESRDITFTFKK